MTRDDIIRMAREAGLAFDSEEYPDIWQTYMYVGREEIERFAALVAAAEREACAQSIERWRFRTVNDPGAVKNDDDIAASIVEFMAAAVRSRERLNGA